MSGNRLEDIEVQVLVDERWLDGWLDTWDKRSDGWFAFVRYQTAPGENRLSWFQQAHVRRVRVAR